MYVSRHFFGLTQNIKEHNSCAGWCSSKSAEKVSLQMCNEPTIHLYSSKTKYRYLPDKCMCVCLRIQYHVIIKFCCIGTSCFLNSHLLFM